MRDKKRQDPDTASPRGGSVLFAVACLALAAWAMVRWWLDSTNGPPDPGSFMLFFGREGMIALVLGPLLVLAVVAGAFGTVWRWIRRAAARRKPPSA